MNYKLVCKTCCSHCWVPGTIECSETGGVDLDEDKDREWKFVDDKGQLDLYDGPCEHENYEIVDSEYDDGGID